MLFLLNPSDRRHRVSSSYKFVLAGLAAALIVSPWIEVSNGDPRPKGGAADLYGLRYRTDINVVFILIDTLRADRLGSYGYRRPTSPTLDYIATTGVRFTDHLAQSSWTKCSMASLWTSLNPPRSGVTRFDHAIPEEATLPAERLSEAGFRTAAIWRNGWVAPNFGFAQGFEVYERPRPVPVPLTVRREKPHVDLHGSDRDVVATASEFLRAHGHERFFLYLHLMDVHQYVYDESSARFGSSYSDVYDNSILFTDTSVGQLLTLLVDAGLLQKTIVVIASDHGEAFSERGIEGHAKHVYRETTQTPLILGLPFRLEDGVQFTAMSRNIDIWPTLFELLGLDPLEGVDGRSLAPELLSIMAGRGRGAGFSTDGRDEDDSLGFSFLDRTWGQAKRAPRPTVAVVDGSLRYVYARGLDGSVTEQLFDRASDPLEQVDVLAGFPERAAEMRLRAQSHLDDVEPAPWGDAAVSVEIDAMELNQLRALGYEIP